MDEIVKKKIILERVVNNSLAPDVKDLLKGQLVINDITEKNTIEEEILNKLKEGLKENFDGINEEDYELYFDDKGNRKIENINFDSIEDGIVIYVKMKNFYLDINQEEAVNELKKIKLEEKHLDITTIQPVDVLMPIS